MAKKKKFPETLNGFFYGVAVSVIAGFIVYALTGKESPEINQTADFGGVKGGVVKFDPEAQIGDKTFNVNSSRGKDYTKYLSIYHRYGDFTSEYDKVFVNIFEEGKDVFTIKRNDLRTLTEMKRELDRDYEHLAHDIHEIEQIVKSAREMEKHP